MLLKTYDLSYSIELSGGMKTRWAYPHKRIAGDYYRCFTLEFVGIEFSARLQNETLIPVSDFIQYTDGHPTVVYKMNYETCPVTWMLKSLTNPLEDYKTNPELERMLRLNFVNIISRTLILDRNDVLTIVEDFLSGKWDDLFLTYENLQRRMS